MRQYYTSPYPDKLVAGLSPEPSRVTGARPESFSVRIHQQDRCYRWRDLTVNGSAHVIQNVRETRALGDHLDCPHLCRMQQLRSLSVFDVGCGPVPADYCASLVPFRFGSEQKPAKHSVVASEAGLKLARLLRTQQFFPSIGYPLQVFWMRCGSPTPRLCLLWKDADVLKPALVDKLVRAIRQLAPHHRWDDIDDFLEPCLRLPRWERALQVLPRSEVMMPRGCCVSVSYTLGVITDRHFSVSSHTFR